MLPCFKKKNKKNEDKESLSEREGTMMQPYL